MKLRNAIFKSMPALVGAILLAATPALAHPHAPQNSPCQLGNGIQHVIYVQFDNTHFLRDNPNVPSDLEQMPHLLNFLKQNGTFDVNDHTVLISHTANGLITSVTGVYGDRNGAAVSNSFGVFAGSPPGSFISFPATFNYWTDKVNQVSSASNDTTPIMVTLDPNGNVKNMPGPWVPFTRAGCNVGAFSFANLEFESATEKLGGKTVLTDVANTYGPTSTQVGESLSQQEADFQGVAVHCAAGNSVCSTANGGIPDLLPDEPGGYTGFNGLFGAKYVAPAVGLPGGLQDLNGNVLTNADSGLVGFTGFDPFANQAPFGQLGMDSLQVSTFALNSTDPTTYLTLEDEIQGWTTTRDTIAAQMKAMLEGAAFGGQAIDEGQAKSLISQAQSLISEAASAAASL